MAPYSSGFCDHSKRHISYFYDPSVGNYLYRNDHPMKPQRLTLTHQLIMGYRMDQYVEMLKPRLASFEEITFYHSEDYITFLLGAREVTLDSREKRQWFERKMRHFGLNDDGDCPLSDGVMEFCQKSVGGSLASAFQLNNNLADIAINWMGGLHHAKQAKASGFCYTNDIVLAILELLKHHSRVLYVDIDVHHGDGVETAFYASDRVMTVSFHKHGPGFFPDTKGAITSIGEGVGLNYNINVPLDDGITDDTYASIFVPVMTSVLARFQPAAIVLQCGADSLSEDIIGPFNLTLKGHGACVSFMRAQNLPLMLLGGGGYTPRNVARCWAYETGLAVGMELPNVIPHTVYNDYFGPTFRLHIEADRTMENMNTRKSLQTKTNTVMQVLRNLPHAPSVQMQPIPNAAIRPVDRNLLADLANPDQRLPAAIMDGVVQDAGDFYDHETEGDDRRNEHDGRRGAEQDQPVEKRARRDEEEEEDDIQVIAVNPVKCKEIVVITLD